VKAEARSVFLAEVSQRHQGEFIWLVLEGAGWHRAKRLQVPAHRRLIPWPPGSPPLNPVEHLWDEGREKRLANRVFDSLHAGEEPLLTALKTWEENATPVAP
jgi:transposase